MLKTKKELIGNLTIAIDKYGSDEEIRNHMQELYIEKKLPVRTVGLTFKGEKTISSLYEIELGIWCQGLYESTEDELINPRAYFSAKEVYEIKLYTNKDKTELRTDTILLHDVKKKIIKGKLFYLCPFVDFYSLLQFDKNSLITYNFETQRDAKLTKYQGKIIKSENVNLQSVDEIASLVEIDELPPSMITLNIRKNESNSECVIYNEETRDLEIKVSFVKEVFADSIDGYHRLLGITKGTILSQTNNKQLEGGVMLLVTNYTPEQSQGYIEIQNRQNKIKTEQIKAFTKDNQNEFIKLLNHTDSESKNMMYDKIANTLDEVEIYEDKYTTISILNEALKLTDLKLGKPYDNEKYYIPYFIHTLNTILGYYMHKYNDDEKALRRECVVLEPNIFVGYIALAKELYDNKNKEELLDAILEETNLKRDAYDWNNLDLYKKSLKSYKKIYDHFVNIVKEVE